MSIKKQSEILQEKKELLALLRERDRRAEKDPDLMLESDLDKEIEWRQDPNRYETSDTILKLIYEVIKRVDGKVSNSK